MLERLLKAMGKFYTPDPRLPQSLVIGVIWTRFVWFLRGIVYLRRRVFLGSGTAFRNTRRIVFGKSVTIEGNCRIDGYCEPPLTLGDQSKIGAGSIISSTSHLSKYGKGMRLGSRSGFGEYCYFGAAGGIEIGDDVIAGQFVSFHSENHVFNDLTSPIREQGVTSQGIVIGDDVWIGARVTVLDGTRVGASSVIAAGAVVSGEFPPYSVIGGVPARVLKSRRPGVQ